MVTPDPNNIKSLQLFFEENKFMNTTEQAQLAGVPLFVIHKWRKKCGIKSTGNGWGSGYLRRPAAFNKKRPPRVYEQVTDPAIWDNPEWLRMMYCEKKYGMSIISKIVGRRLLTVRNRLKKYKIPIYNYWERLEMSRNPCDNRAWLDEHYTVLGYSLTKCAELAKVSRYTIYDWLAKHKIPVRETHHNSMGEKNPWWGKKGIFKFKDWALAYQCHYHIRSSELTLGKQLIQSKMIPLSEYANWGITPSTSDSPPESMKIGSAPQNTAV